MNESKGSYNNGVLDERYIRQLSLPEMGQAEQKRLKDAHIAVIGAGGLGAAALPYLAAAGVGKITIYDDDSVSRSNLHRQTIYKDSDIGESKAALAAAYLRGLNPEIEIIAQPTKIRHPGEGRDLATQRLKIPAFAGMTECNLIFDGSDNFETKMLLNDMSIQSKIPLISASVNQWQGQVGIFAGYAKNKPCYHCLFPELPNDARNCNEAGILGTSAGITGIYQAHLTLCFIAGLEGFEPGRILSFDFKTLRMQSLMLNKNPNCSHCKDASEEWVREEKNMPELIAMQDLSTKDHIIIDVRTDEEIAVDPILSERLIHMELQSVPARLNELPQDKLLAFVCAGNVRSVQAAEYLEGLGYENVCVLDKFSI